MFASVIKMAGVFLTQLVQVVQYGLTAVVLAGYGTKADCVGAVRKLKQNSVVVVNTVAFEVHFVCFCLSA